MQMCSAPVYITIWLFSSDLRKVRMENRTSRMRDMCCRASDFKTPVTSHDEDEHFLADKALKHWPQLAMYRDALCLYGCPVDQVYIYYLLLGAAARFK